MTSYCDTCNETNLKCFVDLRTLATNASRGRNDNEIPICAGCRHPVHMHINYRTSLTFTSFFLPFSDSFNHQQGSLPSWLPVNFPSLFSYGSVWFPSMSWSRYLFASGERIDLGINVNFLFLGNPWRLFAAALANMVSFKPQTHRAD